MREFRTALRRVKVKGGGDVTMLRPVSANNIVQSLRMLADSIEVGDVPASTVIAVIAHEKTIDHYHWGDWDDTRAIGLLTRVIADMTA